MSMVLICISFSKYSFDFMLYVAQTVIAVIILYSINIICVYILT